MKIQHFKFKVHFRKFVLSTNFLFCFISAKRVDTVITLFQLYMNLIQGCIVFLSYKCFFFQSTNKSKAAAKHKLLASTSPPKAVNNEPELPRPNYQVNEDTQLKIREFHESKRSIGIQNIPVKFA